MAIADLFTRTASVPAEGRSAGAAYRTYGARPVRAGEGLDELFAWVDEIVALTQAGAAARGATAVVTLEPCNHTGASRPFCFVNYGMIVKV